jgi:heme/copper-type cytochrome/quinol oxidase subunit 1
MSRDGAFDNAAGILVFKWKVLVTLRGPATATDDPWDANTLEWATTSPPPVYNFDHLPPVRSERPLFDYKHAGTAHGAPTAAVATTGDH